MIISKKEKRIVLVVFISLFIIFTFYDLNFSNWIVNRESLFGQFFYVFGELPGTFIGLVSLSILSVSGINSKKQTINFYGFGLLSFVMSFVIMYRTLNYLDINLFPLIGLGVFPPIILIYTLNQLSDEKKIHLRKYAIVGVLTLIVGVLVPNLVKIGWARPRYRILDTTVLFKAWYNPSGFTLNDDWKSFPSGHSAAAAISLVYLYLPQLFERIRGKEKWIKLFVWVWIILVMLSRVVRGDHYVTDTLVGAGFTYYVFVYLHQRFIEKSKK